MKKKQAESGRAHTRPASRTAQARRILALNRILEKEYGPREFELQGSPLDVLVNTILSQNTNDRNRDSAYFKLRETFATWDDVRKAPAARIENTIRSAGLSRIKAARIKEVLGLIRKERGVLDLDFLADLPDAEALGYLTAFKGVGPKTAACVMLFGLGRPILPVDTHIFRVSKRIGLIEAHVTADQAHDLLAEQVPEALVYPFHLLLIEHGRHICAARRPRCDACVLLSLCAFGKAGEGP